MEKLQSCPKFEIIRIIGAGAFGYVFEAFDQQRRQKVALKRMHKVGRLQSRECEVLQQLKSCNYAINMLDVFYSRTDDNKLVQNIVLEFMDQSLEHVLNDYRKRKIRLQTQKIKSYLYQMLKGIEQIHQKSIAHRDLKPENILLKDNKLKFCDFGSAKLMTKNSFNTPYIVSRYYRAPELLMGVDQYTVSIDIWAIGCIMGELALLEPIFQGISEGDQLFAIFKVLGSMNKKEKDYYDKITKFKKEIFDDMPTYKQQDLNRKFNFLEDKENFIDLFVKLLKYIPEDRLTASQALQHPYFKDLVILESKLQII